MTYFEKDLPVVKIRFEDKEFEINTLIRFTTKIDNNPNQCIQETYYFRTVGIEKELIEALKTYKVKSIVFCHFVKDEINSNQEFIDTLEYPVVKVDQSLFSSGEFGAFDFTIYRR